MTFKEKFLIFKNRVDEFMRRRVDAFHLRMQKLSISFKKNRKRAWDYLRMVIWPRLKTSTRRRLALATRNILGHKHYIKGVFFLLLKVSVLLWVAFYIWHNQLLSDTGSLRVFSWWTLGIIFLVFLVFLIAYLRKKGVTLNWKWKMGSINLPKPKLRFKSLAWSLLVIFLIWFFWFPIKKNVLWVWNHQPTEENIAKWNADALREANRGPARRSDYTCTFTVSKYGDELPILVDDARILTVRDPSAKESCVLSRENKRIGLMTNEDFERMWKKEFPQLKGPTSEWTVIETRSRTYGTTSCFVYDRYLTGRWQAQFGTEHVNRKGDVMMEMSDVTRNLFLGSTKDDAEPNEESYPFTVQCAGGDVPRRPAKQELPEPEVKKPQRTVRENIVTTHT